MNNLAKLMTIITISFILANCSATAKELERMACSQRTDVFTEVPSAGSTPAGFADLIIKASIKIPLPGYYIFESKKEQNYRFLVNIDGQAILWNVEGERHQVPKYLADGTTSHDPEAGEGVKYILLKNVRLSEGTHRVLLGLPEEEYYITKDISVKSGESYVLEFYPEYKYKTLPTRIPTFLRGLKRYDVVFKEVRAH
jgi:hypothetical protein